MADTFRAALGTNNGTAAGSQPTGRRELNWDDGGPPLMGSFATRGSLYTTPGTGFDFSDPQPPRFGDINPTHPIIFTTFSSPSLFTALGSNIIDVRFTVPGTIDQPTLSCGFGAVFTDVDLPSTTSLAFYDPFDNPLDLFYAMPFDNGLS